MFGADAVISCRPQKGWNSENGSPLIRPVVENSETNETNE